jgi:hypothetical protein
MNAYVFQNQKTLYFIPPALIGAEQLLMYSVDVWSHRWPAQALAREANVLL